MSLSQIKKEILGLSREDRRQLSELLLRMELAEGVADGLEDWGPVEGSAADKPSALWFSLDEPTSPSQ